MKVAISLIALLAVFHLPQLVQCYDDFSAPGDESEEQQINSMKEGEPMSANEQSSWLPRLHRMPSGEEIAETYRRFKEAVKQVVNAIHSRFRTIVH
ncbi:hypothetical protein MTO96_043278 [Rhipicephalus appendiculatus]